MYVILENVGNFERHDGGHTWQVVRQSLVQLGYTVRGTEPRNSGGRGLLSPHHLGFPHTRERFFAVASLAALPDHPFPLGRTKPALSLAEIVQPAEDLSDIDERETRLSPRQISCIEHWNTLLANIPESVELPSFPIWSDEFGASYPFRERTPALCTAAELRTYLGELVQTDDFDRAQLLQLFPSYARREPPFPGWKQRFIEQNRAWWATLTESMEADWLARWLADLRSSFRSSLRKLEWNCKGDTRDLWAHMLQFRPSGLRVKRYLAAPALVAMTTTQVPILGPERRFITRTEGLRLQGFADRFVLPPAREAAVRALGNAVHVDVAEAIARGLVHEVGPAASSYVYEHWQHSLFETMSAEPPNGNGKLADLIAERESVVHSPN